MNPEEEKTIKVIIEDGKKIKILRKLLLQCKKIKLALDPCYDANNHVTLNDISTKNFNTLQSCLEIIYALRRKRIRKQIALSKLSKKLDTQHKLNTILSIANHLKAPLLLQLCEELWAKKEYIPKDYEPLSLKIDIEIAKHIKFLQRLFDNSTSFITRRIQNEISYEIDISRNKPRTSITFSPNGEMVAIGHEKGMISVYNLLTHKHKFMKASSNIDMSTEEIKKDKIKDISMLQFSDDTHISSSNSNGNIKLWDINTRENTYTYQHNDCIAYVFNRKEKHLMADGNKNTLCYWNVDDQSKPKILHNVGNVTSLASNSDGSRFISTSCNDKKIRIWNPHGIGLTINNGLVEEISNEEAIWSIEYSNIKNIFVCGTRTGNIGLYCPTKEKIIPLHKKHTNRIHSLFFSNNDTLLCSAAVEDNEIGLWDIRANMPLVKTLTSENEILSIAISPVKDLLCSISSKNILEFWDLKKLTSPIHELRKEFQSLTIKQVLAFKHQRTDNLLKNFSDTAKELIKYQMLQDKN